MNKEQQILKKFEELGWKYKFITDCGKKLYLHKSTKECIYEIFIDLEKEIYYSQNGHYFHFGITLEEHQLLHELFTVWGWFDEN